MAGVIESIIVIAIACAGLMHVVGAPRLRDRLVAFAGLALVALLLVPFVLALVSAITSQPGAHSAAVSTDSLLMIAMMCVGHAALGVEVLRRRMRGADRGHDADRARTRLRTRVPVAREPEREEP
jgi:hypothetical protein